MTRRPAPADALAGRLRAPTGQGEIFSRPPLAHASSLAQANIRLFEQTECRLAGRSLLDFRRWARTHAFAAARAWMAEILDLEIPEEDPDRTLFITGHQPQLTHPGVWMKNFAVGNLARCHQGVGMNLIIDNDLAGASSVRVPVGPREQPAFLEIPYDQPQRPQPWEERQLLDRELFNSFAERTTEALRPWGIKPILNDMWPAAMAAANRSRRTSDCLSACRIAQERHWGLGNLELPMSRLCETEPFLAFVAHICRRPRAFRDCYNQTVHSYRSRYGVRNAQHPVPDLEIREDRFEAPFWYWESQASDRERLFVRVTAEHLEFFAGNRLLASSSSPAEDLSTLLRLQKAGRLRPRALSTTLFARLGLGDLFVHGIGGARYDEITDRLMERFFDCPPPAFLTLTATLHLPLSPFVVSPADLEFWVRQQRDTRFHAENFLTSERAILLRQRKEQLIEQGRAFRRKNLSKSDRRRHRAERRQQHIELKAIAHELAELAQDQQKRAGEMLAMVRSEVRANQILKSREFPASLFPSEMVRELASRIADEVCVPCGNA